MGERSAERQGLLSRLPVKHLSELLGTPMLVPKVVRNYVRLAVLKRPVLRSVDFATTFECQARCAHCYSGEMRDENRSVLSESQVVRTLDECLRLGALAVNLAGGESLLDRRIFSILRHVKPWQAVTVVTTNGLLLTAENVRRLRESRLYLLAVSLDAPDAEGHDAFRGTPGLFDAAVSGIRRARRAGIRVMINTMISADKLRDGTVDRMVELARGQGAVLNLILPAYAGEQKKHGTSFLAPDTLSLLRRYLSLPDVRWDGSSNYLREGCGAGVEKIAITPYGDVLACALIQASFGNVLEEPLEAIWKRMLRVKEFAEVNDFCLAANDPAFVERYMKKIAGKCAYPCRAAEIFPDVSGR